MRQVMPCILGMVFFFGAFAQQPPHFFGTNYAYMQPTYNTGVSINSANAVYGDIYHDQL